jgi:hypothetical protein
MNTLIISSIVFTLIGLLLLICGIAIKKQGKSPIYYFCLSWLCVYIAVAFLGEFFLPKTGKNMGLFALIGFFGAFGVECWKEIPFPKESNGFFDWLGKFLVGLAEEVQVSEYRKEIVYPQYLCISFFCAGLALFFFIRLFY